MDDNVGMLIVLNGNVEAAKSIRDEDIYRDGAVVYEVIRIIDGVPLFFEDHCERMENSLRSLGESFPAGMDELRRDISAVLSANRLLNCNVKVMVFKRDGRQNTLMYISRSYYPDRHEVENGVPVSFMNWERNSPNVKQVNNAYREEVGKRIAQDKVFEVLLVNNSGYITEGSKSNVFFASRGKIYTPPEAYVLKGITRKYVFDACRDAGVELVEQLAGIDFVRQADGLFLSGTSIKVLPVCSVDGTPCNSASNAEIIAVRDSFDRIVEAYIEKNRR